MDQLEGSGDGYGLGEVSFQRLAGEQAKGRAHRFALGDGDVRRLAVSARPPQVVTEEGVQVGVLRGGHGKG